MCVAWVPAQDAIFLVLFVIFIVKDYPFFKGFPSGNFAFIYGERPCCPLRGIKKP